MARRGRSQTSTAPKRDVDYRNLVNPFPSMDVFSEDEIANMHATALRTLEELGIRVLLPEARDLLAAGGSRVDGDIAAVHLNDRQVRQLVINRAVHALKRFDAGREFRRKRKFGRAGLRSGGSPAAEREDRHIT